MLRHPRSFRLGGPASLLAAIASGVILTGCDTASGDRAMPVFDMASAPPGAPPASCWGRTVAPAVIETVTHQVMMQPAEVRADGTVARPALFKTETTQEIVTPRRETWFETPCPAQLTPELIASLQRALAARGAFHGPVTGEMDSRTRAAVRRYQAPQGVDSGVLSLAAARKLGLIALPRPDAE
jgi:hypothetical protein